jgi:hypothetical protein
MTVDITPNILESDARSFPCVALAIKAQGGNYDSVLIPSGNQIKVFSIGSSETVAYSCYTLDDSLDAVHERMKEGTKNIMPHLRETLFKYDTTNKMIFFNSKEMSLTDLVRKD